MPRYAAAILVVVVLVSAGLRLWQLDRAALWEDDYLNLDRGLEEPARMWSIQKWQGPADTPYDFQPPLSFAVLHAALGLSQDSFAARLPAVLAGVLAVLGTFALGRRTLGSEPGVLAALLLGFSLFHIDYSRAIKAYGLFYCFSVWSAVFAHDAVRRGRVRDLAGWFLTATGMLYSAYIGAPAFAGEALWAGMAVLPGVLRREPGMARRAASLAVTAAAVGLAYLPWLPAVLFLRDMFASPGANPLARLDWAFARDILDGYYAHIYPAPAWLAPLLCGLAAAGAAFAVVRGRLSGLALLVLWAGLPTASVLLSKSVMSAIVSSRHLFNLLGLMTLLPAAGAWWLARLVPWGRGVALAAGAALCLALNWPQIAQLPGFYARSISLDRDYFYWLWASQDPGEGLMTEGWKRKSKAFGARWHLPGLFASPGDFDSPGYRRIILTENQAAPGPLLALPDLRVADDYSFGPFRTRTSVLGAVSRSPVRVVPDERGRFVYSDGFDTLGMLGDAFAASNVAPDLTLGMLSPVRASMPGEVLYCFTTVDGVRIRSASLELAATLYKANAKHPSDSVVEVLAGPARESLKPVLAINQAGLERPDGALPLGPCTGYEEQPMYQTCARGDFLADVTDVLSQASIPVVGGRELWLAIRFQPGVSEGFWGIDTLRLDVDMEGTALPDGAVTRQALTDMLAANRVKPWSPGAVAQEGLFAFAAREGLAEPGLPLGSPDDLAAFRAEHPGLEPVTVLRDEAGRDAAFFYDPPLRLSKDVPQAKVEGGQGFDLRGLVIRGRLDVPSLRVGGSEMAIPVSAPGGSVLMLDPGGEGRLIWSPDFSREGFAKLGVSSSENLRPAPDADNDGGLTCREERPCSFTARFVSALPVREVLLEWYPRVVAAPDGKNVARLSYSTDEGKTFKILEEFKGGGTGKWTGMFAKHARRLAFDKPVNHFLLLVELSGEAAQLWSHARPVDRMWLEARLDARSLPVLPVPGGSFPVALVSPGDNDLTVRLLDRPVPFFDRIKYWR